MAGALTAPGPTAAPPVRRLWTWTALLLVLLLATYVRLHHLGGKSLWADELFSVSTATDHALLPADGVPWLERIRILDVELGQSFWTVKAADQSPPLFELAVRLSVAVLGLSEFAARLPSALAGIALVGWLCWRSVRGRGQTERHAFGWAALFCAIAPEAVAYGQEARAYSLGMLWAGVLTGLWYRRWLRSFASADSPRWPEIGVFVLGCYTHFNLILLSAVMLSAYGWVALRRRDGAALARMAVVPLACLPWVMLVAHTFLFTMDGGIAWVQLTWYQVVAQSLGMLPRLFPWAWVALTLASALLLRAPRGRRLAGTPEPLPPWTPAAALVGLVAIYLVLLGFMVARSGIFHHRHLMFVLPALALLAGHLLSPLRRGWWTAGVVALAVALVVAQVREVYRRPTNDFRSAFSHLIGTTEPDAPLVGITPADRRFYVDVLTPGSTRPVILLGAYEDHPERYAAACQRVDSLGARQFGVVTHAIRQPFIAALMQRCGGRYELAEAREFSGVLAQRWRFRGAGDASPR